MKPSRSQVARRASGGYARHYHRADSATRTTWNDWIDNDLGRPRRPWLKIALIAAAVLALAAVMAGLIIEMRPI